MKISATPASYLPPRHLKSHEESEDHSVTDGIQIGHDVGAIGDAAAKASGHASHAARAGRWLSEISREEMLEMRSLAAREGRQAAVIGENAHLAPHSALRTGAAVLNGAVAVGAVWHGVELLKRPEPLAKVEGVNHLLMGAGAGLIAGHLAGGSEALGHVGGQLLVAHGVGEVGIGTYRAVRGEGSERVQGLLQVAHGAALIGAEMVPGAALPLCAAMLGITGIQVVLHHREHSGEAH